MSPVVSWLLLFSVVGIIVLATMACVRMASLDDRRWDVRDAYEEDDR